MTIYVTLELSLCIGMEMGDKKRNFKSVFKLFQEKIGGTNPAIFQGFFMIDSPIGEDLVEVNIFLSDIDFLDGATIGELAENCFGNHSKTVRLLRCNSHISIVFNINALLKIIVAQIINKPGNLESHLRTCMKPLHHIFLKNAYQFRQTLFDKFDWFVFPYTDNLKLSDNMAIFDFESVYVKNENFKATGTRTWIGKHIAVSVSMLSNLVQEHIFLCDPKSRDLVSSFIDALEILAEQSKAQTKKNFLQI